MQIGVVFPQTEIGADVAGVRAYGDGSRSSGSPTCSPTTTCSAPTPRRHAPWSGPYDVHTTFHEPFVLFGYLAAFTRLELVTGRDHPAPAPDRARRQAGRRGRPADGGPVPARRRHRLEPRRVRGARRDFSDRGGGCPSRSRCCAGCSPSRSSPTWVSYDRITGRRHRSAAGAAADPDLDRRPVAARVPAHRPPRRRLVPRRCRRGRRSTRRGR